MTLLQAVILGVIQGITEFLPVSSSGHLIFLPALFQWPDQGLAFDVVVHLGTLTAVVWYFRRKLWGLVLSVVHPSTTTNTERRLAFLLALSIIPAGVAGFVFGDWIEEHTRSAAFVAYGLIGWGLVLGLADWYSRRQKVQLKSLDIITFKDVLWIAAAQALALLPGTSRSGITMTAGLFRGLSRTAVAEFSFLMSVPVIALAGVVKIAGLIQSGFADLELSLLLVGFVTSALSGLLAIWAMLRIIQCWNFLPFVFYRIAIGLLILWII